MNNVVRATMLCASMLIATPAFAAHELPPNDTLSPFAGGGSLAPTGGLLADTGDQFLTTSVAGTTLSVILRAAVYDAPGGFLDFLYQVTNQTSSNTSVKDLSFADFAGFDISSPGTGAWQQYAPFGVFTRTGVEGADSAMRSADGSVLGVAFDTIGVTADLDSGSSVRLNPGETSSIFQFRVVASNFQPGTFAVLNGVSVTGLGFAPATAVPEPATWLMMIGAFGMIGGVMRSRSRKTRVSFV